MMATVAFEIVRTLGVFRRYGALAGAACVGLVHHAFYEIFDHLGPQLRWWEWALDNPMNKPFFDSVPMGSVVVFAALWPMSLALCAQLLLGRHVEEGRSFTPGQIIWRTVVVGVLASIGTAVLPLPATIAGAVSGSTAVVGVVYALELMVLVAVAVPVLIAQWLAVRRDGANGYTTHPAILIYAGVYLAVMTLLWATALPDYFGATNGVTTKGDPIGSLWYAVMCLGVAAACTAAAWTVIAPIRRDDTGRGVRTIAANTGEF